MIWWFSSMALASWPALQPAETGAPVDGSQDAALIVGISDYLLVPDVVGATDNTQDWYDYLVHARGVPASHVRYLRDAEANNSRILRMADEVAGLGTGRVWTVFVGHGAPSMDGTDGLLVGVDASGDPQTLADRSVRKGDLLSALSSTGRPVVAILDTCFSGTTSQGEALVPALQPLVPTYAVRPLPAGVSVATAAAVDQFAGPLPGESRPAFSYLMLGAAQGWGDADGDGVITLEESVAFAGATLQAEVVRRRQTPNLEGDGALVLGHGVQALPGKVASKADVERKGPRKLGWKIATGVLATSAAGFGANSVYNYSLLQRNTTPSSLNASWSGARSSGAAAYTLGAASVGTFFVSVL